MSDEQLEQLERYAVGLLEWNKKINLISRRDEENFWTRHILHCVSLTLKAEIPTGVMVLDLGTGGGLPGIVLKIVRPDLLFTLVDSTQKKINVVKDLVGSLGLVGIDAIWGRAEDLGKQREYAKRYDVVVVRAVAPLKDLVRWSYPLVKKSSAARGANAGAAPEPSRKQINTPSLVAFKGGDLESEIWQIRTEPNIGPISTIDLTLKGSTQLDDGDKKIVVVEYVRSKS